MTMEKLFQLLTEQNHTLIMKTLGLIRNLITNRVHIDQIMLAHGNKIIQAIVMVLEGEFYSLAIKEQALCILANVADGHTAKEFIMGNEDLLRKINSFMVKYLKLKKNLKLFKLWVQLNMESEIPWDKMNKLGITDV